MKKRKNDTACIDLPFFGYLLSKYYIIFYSILSTPGT